MWAAMRQAELGWVIDRQDASVQRLEKMAAEMMGKEAAVFVLTGRMACLTALMTYGQRGNQVVLEKYSHLAWAQEWSLAYVCGLYPRLVEGRFGVMDSVDLEEAITEARFKHVPRTDLVCLENTHNMSGGRVLSVAQTEALSEVAHRHGAKVFLDGCRIFHASASLGVKPAALAAPVEAVVISLIKGLCGPGGALLCGPGEDMNRAHHNLKRIGGHAFHRAGMLAAAGIVALETMVDRLREDIVRAKAFAQELNQIKGIAVDLDSVESNIVMADISATGLDSDEFLKQLLARGIKGHKFTEEIVRFTFHRHIGEEEVAEVIAAVRQLVGDGA